MSTAHNRITGHEIEQGQTFTVASILFIRN